MLMRTHAWLAAAASDDWSDEERRIVDRAAFIAGSTLPDRRLDMRLMTHDYSHTGRMVFRLVESLVYTDHDPVAFGRKLGVIAHFVADYACAYHSHPKYHNRISGHLAYEHVIDRLTAEFTSPRHGEESFRSLSTVRRELEAGIARRHAPDAIPDPMADLANADATVRSLTRLILSERLEMVRSMVPTSVSKLRLAIVSDTYYPHVNGVSNTLFQMLSYLKRKKIPYLLICPEYKTMVPEKERGIRIVKVKSHVFPFYRDAAVAIPDRRRLDQILDGFRPDVLHVMTEFTLGSYGLSYGGRRGIPVISNFSTYFHLEVDHYRIGSVKLPLQRYLDRFHERADSTSTPSSVTRRYLNGRGLDRVFVFGRGIATDAFSPRYRSEELRDSWGAQNKTVLLYVGRIAGEKEIGVLCEARDLLPDVLRNRTVLVIAGDGPDRAALQHRHPDVIFTGMIVGSALSAIYASADVFAFPSPSETLGNVVLEAMASGLAVLCVNEGGVRENVFDGDNGLLVEPHRPDRFAIGLMRLLTEPGLRDRLAAAGLAHARNRTWDAVFERLLIDYDRVRTEKQVRIPSHHPHDNALVVQP